MSSYISVSAELVERGARSFLQTRDERIRAEREKMTREVMAERLLACQTRFGRLIGRKPYTYEEAESELQSQGGGGWFSPWYLPALQGEQRAVMLRQLLKAAELKIELGGGDVHLDLEAAAALKGLIP